MTDNKYSNYQPYDRHLYKLDPGDGFDLGYDEELGLIRMYRQGMRNDEDEKYTTENRLLEQWIPKKIPGDLPILFRHPRINRLVAVYAREDGFSRPRTNMRRGPTGYLLPIQRLAAMTIGMPVEVENDAVKNVLERYDDTLNRPHTLQQELEINDAIRSLVNRIAKKTRKADTVRCVHGKRCGNTCISALYKCTVPSFDPTRVKRTCTFGKRCGVTCISRAKTCRKNKT